MYSRVLINLAKRELNLAFVHNFSLTQALIFFLTITSLFAISVNLPQEQLAPLAPAIVWVVFLLAMLLSQENLLREDFKIGLFEQYLISTLPMPLLMLIKVIANWLATGFCLSLFVPIVAMMFGVKISPAFVLFLTLVIGSLAISLLNAIGTSLTINSGRNSLLLSIILFPLYLPVLILGVMAVNQASANMDFLPAIALMLAISLACSCLAPFTITYAIKVNLE